MISNLNNQQLAAVMSDAKRTMVIAGAGAGKTRVLIARIEQLLSTGVQPDQIVALTFTRKAAREMKTRLEDIIGGRAHNISCGTSHSLAAEMIRRYKPDMKTSTIYGPIETEMVLKDVAEAMGVYKKKKWNPSRTLINDAMLNYAVQGILPMESHPEHNFFMCFRHRCAQNNAMTYDDLLVKFRAQIHELPVFKTWKHILVDECQDLTPLQWYIINEIRRCFGASIFAVGDLDQSIYRFRGAYPDYMLTDCADYKKFILETNYRSLPDIVECANNVIRHNKNRFEKDSIPNRTSDIPSVFFKSDMDSAAIVEEISLLPESTEMAVLSRNHFLLKKVSTLLTERKIYHTYAGSKNDMLRTLPAIEFHSFLRLLVNPMNNFSFMVIRKILCVTNQEYADIRLRATETRQSHLVAWVMSEWSVTRFVKFFKDNSNRNVSLPYVLIAFDNLFRETGDEYFIESHILPVLNFAEKWMAETEAELSVQNYLDYVALFDVADEMPDRSEVKPNITLSTIHAAKGLEFENVIIAGMNEGIFPGSRAVDDEDEMMDERRLAYVAFTRAENRLIMTSRPTQYLDKISPVSRFIGEAFNG